MEAKNYGKIVSISSIAATVGLEGAPHYSAAKARNLDMSQAVLLGALTHKQAE